MAISRASLLSLLSAASLGAQTQYYNLDAGRPGRVEDAEVTARYALGIDLAPLQLERIAGGTLRLRTEPKLTYGVLPFTDVELRLPIVRIEPARASGARAATGLAGLAIGGMHAFNLETAAVPALAMGAELSFPVGALAPPHASYLAKALLTKTTAVGRIHVNAGAGSYSVRVAAPVGDTACTNATFTAGQIPRPGQGCQGGPPIIVDSPCNVVPGAGATTTASFARLCMAPAPTTTAIAAPPRPHGARWFGGVAYDRALPLSSTVFTADLFAERYRGLYAIADWTTEAGVRRQLTPLLVVDAGAAWHFAGAVHSASLTLGASYELATPPVGHR